MASTKSGQHLPIYLPFFTYITSTIARDFVAFTLVIWQTKYSLLAKSNYQLLPKTEKAKSHIPDKKQRKITHPQDFGL
jgi:hypothetical protein